MLTYVILFRDEPSGALVDRTTQSTHDGRLVTKAASDKVRMQVEHYGEATIATTRLAAAPSPCPAVWSEC